jgi:PAS domain S-box-containing protein
VELRTGRLVGFEVLARWNHPQHGLILPENFIRVAEENGLLPQLMKQILHKAFASGSLLPDPLTLAVNVSPAQLHDPGLPKQIHAAALAAGFPLKRLTVEITESALVGDLEAAQAVAGELKTMGCSLALDDFGTGYSSLAHLQALPFDVLKIDRSFISSMTKKRDSRKIVAAIVGLGHSLGLRTLAEGIETEEQSDMLLWLGCEYGQGWLYGKAVTADQVPGIVSTMLQPSRAGVPTPGDSWAVSNLEASPALHLSQLQAIYDGAPVGLCFLDRNFRYVSINRRLAEMNGASVAEHVGRTVAEMIPDAFAGYEPYLLRAMAGEAITSVEVPRPSPESGAPGRMTMASYQPAWDEADEVIGISIAVTDITALKQTEEALRESENHLQHLSETTQRVPWIMDKEGNSMRVSADWVRSADAGKAQVRNLGWLEALHIDDLEPTMRVMRNALLSGDSIDVKYRVRDLEGEWKWVRSRGAPRFGSNGEILRWYGTVEDTEQPMMFSVTVANT